MAQTDNASDLQEILPKALPIGSDLEGDSDKVSQQALRVSMDRLSLETLKMLCKGEGLSEIGEKKELLDKLASRIVDKAKERDRGEENSQSGDVQEGRVDIDSDCSTREKF